MVFNPKMVVHDLDDVGNLGYTGIPFLGNIMKHHETSIYLGKLSYFTNLLGAIKGDNFPYEP